jgi:UDP-N-acetylmuramoyl-tripeptide--D-alanyl-D-alanine ligase
VIGMSLAQVAAAVGGTLHDCTDPDVVVTGPVEFDSRRVAAGSLFVALPGERVDGHAHAAAAVAAGAVGVLAARPVGVPAVVVSPTGGTGSRVMALAGDTDGSGAAVLAALGRLARASIDALPEVCVIGVTGSSGKTSTKDLLAAVLAPLGPLVAPPGSFNNELGHPWTVLRATPSTANLVLELSARGVGHVAALCAVAPPRIGVVLNVGTAHLGEFGSREAIARGKGELVEALPPAAAGGVAVLNADDPLVAAMASRTTARVVFVGTSTRADVRAVDVRLDDEARARFRMTTPVGEVEVALAVHGEHQVGNALAAAAVGLERGATLAQVAESLGLAAAVSERRMDVRTRADGVTVVNDAYNANPDSVKAALKALVSMSRTGGRGTARRRCWAVLGEMGELGPDAVREHDAIGRYVVRLDVSRLVVVGALGSPTEAVHRGAYMEGSWGDETVMVPDVEAALALLRAEVEPGDVVLVKASKSVALWRVAEGLLADEDNGDAAEHDTGDDTGVGTVTP